MVSDGDLFNHIGSLVYPNYHRIYNNEKYCFTATLILLKFIVVYTILLVLYLNSVWK